MLLWRCLAAGFHDCSLMLSLAVCVACLLTGVYSFWLWLIGSADQPSKGIVHLDLGVNVIREFRSSGEGGTTLVRCQQIKSVRRHCSTSPVHLRKSLGPPLPPAPPQPSPHIVIATHDYRVSAVSVLQVLQCLQVQCRCQLQLHCRSKDLVCEHVFGDESRH